MLRTETLESVEQTGQNMYRMATAWAQDMQMHSSKSMQEVFDLLRNIPYIPDPAGAEYLQRPFYTLNSWGGGGDCDDKAIAAGSWATLNHVPFRFVAVSRFTDKPLHHVFTEMYIQGKWINFDPTYSFNALGWPMNEFPQRLVLRP